MWKYSQCMGHCVISLWNKAQARLGCATPYFTVLHAPLSSYLFLFTLQHCTAIRDKLLALRRTSPRGEANSYKLYLWYKLNYNFYLFKLAPGDWVWPSFPLHISSHYCIVKLSSLSLWKTCWWVSMPTLLCIGGIPRKQGTYHRHLDNHLKAWHPQPTPTVNC